jgi:hypothetical protein
MQRLTLFIAAVVVPLAATLNNQFLQFDIHSMHRTDQNAMSLDAMLNGSSDQLIAAIGSGATSGGRKGKQRRHTETLVGEAPELAAIGSGATSGGRKGKQRRHTETFVGETPKLAMIG